jgi:molecular chaperone HtpG
MQNGTINVTTENIFPIIKKFLYSDHEIFLRELVSNAVDATQKLRTLSSVGKYSGDTTAAKVSVALDKDKKTLTISDEGLGMTADEVRKYITEIAFSGAEEFVGQYKDKANAIIGHFGLGFYSSFMVASKVEIVSLSYQEGAEAVRWECDGSTNYTMEAANRDRIGTDIILHIDTESEEFLEESRIAALLEKYCKFLPVPIVFGKKKDWKDGQQVDTEEDSQINDVSPAWTKKPAELKEEDYNKFYKDLYPFSEDPLFHIHLNVDYPFNLTGILYFPKIKNNVEVQKNKIQLYCNQVFVTDHVEGIVPEFLTLLHGVIDSPDIPLNVSRSYLQSDQNVKKISSHITKKVADRLSSIFKEDRAQYEQKWDSLKLFIVYGMLTDEKFYEKATSFALLKNTDGKYFTLEEYKILAETNQKDKNGDLIYLYTSDAVGQHAYIEKAKAKGYDVLVLDGQLDNHLVNHLEPKLEKTRFARVDADIIEKLIQKDEVIEAKLSSADKTQMRSVFEGCAPSGSYFVSLEDLQETDSPIIITQNEFMRRMKDMSAMNGGMASMYGSMPDSYNMVINANHPLVGKILQDRPAEVAQEIAKAEAALKTLKDEQSQLEKLKEGKKEEEVPTEEKEKLDEVNKKIREQEDNKTAALKNYGKQNPLVKQLIDLALISNNMLKGEELSKFVSRSIELIK